MVPRCALFRPQALEEAAERARELEMFVAMAPEGTRTKTGQLGPFKKVSVTETLEDWGAGGLFGK